jgi:hypothetical protein
VTMGPRRRLSAGRRCSSAGKVWPGAANVLATLLHEAAHALAHVRGIKDTSRQGRWHNARFKALAEEVGIAVEKDPRLGWSPTTLPAVTRASYAQVIAELGAVLRLYRAVEISGRQGSRPGQPPCVCTCGRKIRVAKSALSLGPTGAGCAVASSGLTPTRTGTRDEANRLAHPHARRRLARRAPGLRSTDPHARARPLLSEEHQHRTRRPPALSSYREEQKWRHCRAPTARHPGPGCVRERRLR